MKKEHVILRETAVVTAVLFVGAIAAFLLPTVGYTSNNIAYTLNQFHFITGTTISSGTVRVEPNALTWMTMICLFAGLVAALLSHRMGKRTAYVCAGFAVIAMAAQIAFSMRVEMLLNQAGAKRVGVQYGYLAVIGAAWLALMCSMRTLAQTGSESGRFHIIGLVVGIAAAMSVPVATYTYRKVGHPFTLLDMLGNKEIAADGVFSHASSIPVILIGCCLAMIALSLLCDLKRKRTLVALLILSAAVIVSVVVASTTVLGMLEGAKSPKASIASLIPAVLAAAVFVWCLYLLYKAKTLSALDFMMVPGLLYLLINNYIPMVGILLAFKKIDYSVGIWNSPWCGFDNFRYLFSSRTAWIITRNTLLYNLVFIVIGIVTGMIVGLCLFAVTKKLAQTFFQTTILLPQLISMIVVAYIVYAFLSNEAGFVNNALLGGTDTNFYGESWFWPFLLVFINNWKQLGYNSIIFLSSIVGIDRGLYEAAQVDGCNAWQQITKITIPQLKPTIITLSLLQIGRVFYSDFGLFYQVPLDSGALYNVTNTIDTYVYRSLMVLNNISSASAASAFQAVCGFILVLTVNLIVRKVDRDNALF